MLFLSAPLACQYGLSMYLLCCQVLRSPENQSTDCTRIVNGAMSTELGVVFNQLTALDSVNAVSINCCPTGSWHLGNGCITMAMDNRILEGKISLFRILTIFRLFLNFMKGFLLLDLRKYVKLNRYGVLYPRIPIYNETRNESLVQYQSDRIPIGRPYHNTHTVRIKVKLHRVTTTTTSIPKLFDPTYFDYEE